MRIFIPLKFWVLFCCLIPIFSPDVFSWPTKKENPPKASKVEDISEKKASPADLSLQAPNKSHPIKPPKPLPKIVDLPYLTKIPEPPKIVLPPAPPAPYPVNDEIIKAQKQIQEILKVNESLKSQYFNQAAEIERITEQAKIHQKMLQSVTPAELKNDLVAQQKVKIIHDETNKNHDYIESLTDHKAIGKKSS